MSSNSTTSLSASLLLSHLHCLTSRPSSVVFVAFIVSNASLVLPLCLFILGHAILRCCRSPPCSSSSSSSSSSSPISHSDSFTYHLVVMEMVGFLGTALFSGGVFRDDPALMSGGILLQSFIWNGETFFHMLTCLERYVAVVRPISYLRLKGPGGVRLRSACIAAVWLLCFAGMVFPTLGASFEFADLCLTLVSLAVISACSLSVLCVLVRPGPGGRGEDGAGAGRAKRRALRTIVAILAALLLRCSWCLTKVGLQLAGDAADCLTIICGFWLCVPGSLVLPLLFLCKPGKCGCLKKTQRE